jgi:hypothetical protein
MLVEAAPVPSRATGMPTAVVPTKNCTVPVGMQEGAVGLHCAGVTVVVTVKATEYCGLPVAGEVMTVFEDVAVRIAPIPLSIIVGT